VSQARALARLRRGPPWVWAAIPAAGLALALLPLRWLAVAVPAAIVVGLTLVRPAVALCLLCLAIPFGSLAEVRVAGLAVGPAEALLALAFAAWLARTVALREENWRWPRLAAPLALFIGAALLSWLNAASLTLAAKETIKWLEFLALLFMVANGVDRAQSRAVVASLLLAGVAQAALGAVQFFTRSGPEFFAMGRFLRAYGTFEQPNPFGGYMGLVAPLALALGLEGLNRRPSAATPVGAAVPGWLAYLAAGAFLATAAGLGMSGSRGAWLAFAAAFCAVIGMRSRRAAVAFTALLAVAALIVLLGGVSLLSPLIGPAIGQRLTSFVPLIGARDVPAIEITDANYANVERLAFWQAALDMWRDRPWLGVGFGNYAAAYPRYALPKWRASLGHAHNYYLNVAAETGLLGLAAYLALWLAAFWQTARAARREGDPYVRALALGALGVLVHVSVHNVVDNLWVHDMYLQVALLLGLVQGLSDRRPRPAQE
jgi:putative inorganic carbon (HCO3(-)) transporter